LEVCFVDEKQFDNLIMLGVFLPFVKDVLIKKNVDGVYDRALALLHQDLRKMKESLYRENISIEKLQLQQQLFQGYKISQKGRTIEKSFFKPHMNNVIKSLITKYVCEKTR
jgi:hypothetical protein